MFNGVELTKYGDHIFTKQRDYIQEFHVIRFLEVLPLTEFIGIRVNFAFAWFFTVPASLVVVAKMTQFSERFVH